MPLADFVDTTDLSDFRAGDPETIVEQAQARIRAYCGWHVAPEITETLTIDGRGGCHLWLPSLLIKTIVSVVDEGITLTEDEFDWSVSGYLERRSGWWSSRPRQIVVTLTHGYEAAPEDVVGVAVAWASRAASSPAGLRREAAGSVSLDYGTIDLLADERAVLDRYKLPPRS